MKSVNFEGDFQNKFYESFNDRNKEKDKPEILSTSRSIKSRASGRNTQLDQLRNTLYFDARTQSIPKTAIKNQVVEEILSRSDAIFKNPKLHQSILKLRELDLLKKNEPSINKFKGIGKVNYVYNDFHSRSTNPGYSRNTGGNFYYR